MLNGSALPSPTWLRGAAHGRWPPGRLAAVALSIFRWAAWPAGLQARQRLLLSAGRWRARNRCNRACLSIAAAARQRNTGSPVTTRSEVRSTTWCACQRRFAAFCQLRRGRLAIVQKTIERSIGAGAARQRRPGRFAEQNQRESVCENHPSTGRKRITIRRKAGRIRGTIGSGIPALEGIGCPCTPRGHASADCRNASVVPPAERQQPMAPDTPSWPCAAWPSDTWR